MNQRLAQKIMNQYWSPKVHYRRNTRQRARAWKRKRENRFVFLLMRAADKAFHAAVALKKMSEATEELKILAVSGVRGAAAGLRAKRT